MSRLMRLFYYGVLGAIGGLIGWQISNILGLSFFSNLYLAEIVVGGLIGLSIGVFIGLADGILNRNPVLGLRSCLSTGLLGLAGGAIGLPIAEGLFQVLGGGELERFNWLGNFRPYDWPGGWYHRGNATMERRAGWFDWRRTGWAASFCCPGIIG